VWKRAISENEEKLNEMNQIVSEKMALQQRLITRLQQYVRVHDNTLQRQEPSAAVDSSSSSNALNDEGDDEETLEQDEHSAELSVLVDSLKTMTSGSVQVPHHYHLTSYINGHFPVFLTPPDVRLQKG